MRARIKEKREVAERTLMVVFDLLGEEVDFRPGQYFWVTLIDPPYDDEKGSRRHITVVTSPPQPSVFTGPAPRVAPVEAGVESVLNPFSVYEKGETLLRKQLGALSAWHLVNIIAAYNLSSEDTEILNRRPAADLIDVIVAGVRSQREIAGQQK